MINLKFFKTQLKNSIWITIGLALVPITISMVVMLFNYYFWQKTIQGPHGSVTYSGALSGLGLTTIFGPVGEVIGVACGVSLAIKLINSEISKGYMSYWLSLPMSRIAVLAAKVLTILLSTLIISLSNLLVELIIAFAKYPDFGGSEVWILIKLNFGLMLTFFFIASLAVFFSVLFDKTSVAITLSIVVLVIFIVIFILSSFVSKLDGLNFLEYFKYITFFSLFDFNQLIVNDNLAFIWKFILLFVFGSSLFLGSGFIFKNKNLLN